MMNFTPIYIHKHGNAKQGYQLPNGSFTGSLGQIEKREADYSANSLLISSSYNTSNVLFVNSIEMEQFVFVIQKQESPKEFSISMFSAVDVTTRIIFLMLAIFLPIIYTLITKYEFKIAGTGKKVYFVTNVMDIIALQLNISIEHQGLHASRVMIASILFFALIMNSIFQGTIVSSLNNDSDNGTIKTLDELIEKEFKLLIHHDITAVLIALGGKWLKLVADSTTVTMNDTSVFADVAKTPKTAYLTSKLLSGNFLDQLYDKETGENCLEEVPEVIFEFYTSAIIPKDSPFVESFKEFTLRYRESGLRTYQANRATHDKDKFMIQRLLDGMVPKKFDKTIELSDLRAMFQLYLMLNLLAIFVLFGEILWSFASASVKRKFEALRCKRRNRVVKPIALQHFAMPKRSIRIVRPAGLYEFVM